MPIYEYRCEPCDHTFEVLARGSNDAARCPRCGDGEVEKQFSVPAAVRSGTGSLPIASPMPSGGCGRPQCGTGGCGFD